jgi:hypothetical protein
MATQGFTRQDFATYHSATRGFAALALTAVLACAAPQARAGDTGSGHFRMGDNGATFKHAVAVRHEQHLDPEEDEVFVFLSDHPLDPAIVAAAFDPDDGARESYGDRSGGYVRVCLSPDGGECGLYYTRNDPDDSFNSSGYGDLSIAAQTRDRIAGRWTLDEPEDFFGKTYDFDLRFDAAIHTPPGTPLPAGGGDAGAAYRAYAAAVAKGDIVVLRGLMGEDARWRLPDDDDERVKETLKELRDEQPVAPEVLRGRRHGDTVVLWVRGSDRDDIARTGRVRMQWKDGRWSVGEQDLDAP